MSAIRPLPPTPNLEFEHKAAKALLRRLRAGDTDALARAHVRHSAIDATEPPRIRLADAQLVIAREYGFTSWPRLVRYFGDVERQRHNQPSVRPQTFYDGRVRGLLADHRARGVWAARTLASYVPRFYGMRADDVFASEVTEDDARLVTARSFSFPSWDVLVEQTAEDQLRRGGGWDVPPMQLATRAMERGDLTELQRIVDAHPELLRSSGETAARGHSLVSVAMRLESTAGATAMAPIFDWLSSRGLDRQRELNDRLRGYMRMPTAEVRHLLDSGADPNWLPPNGIPLLEHALIRYWNGEAVDLLASRVTPRRALWISAGLGDVAGVRRFLDANGKPTERARRLRPYFDAVSPLTMPSHPDPDDEEILMEAFFVAMINGRTAVLDYMASRGCPVNSLLWGTPVITIAVANAMTLMIEPLVRCGADLDLRGTATYQSAREIARAMHDQMPDDENRRHIAELCGLDVAAIAAARSAQPKAALSLDPRALNALELAGDDAYRRGGTAITPENLLFGLLRRGGLPVQFFSRVSRMDSERFHADVASRVDLGADRVERPVLELDAEARAVVEAAVALAAGRRRGAVADVHLLYALTLAEGGIAATTLARYGGDLVELNKELDRSV
ncbi:MAG TPA: Clp protease N-terminal domain-containing protein [Gemmatimonadaceae bacterium]|nr:Clp protease N-terminal domain-containing protein [Gemmatimonadaceae bacterium]